MAYTKTNWRDHITERPRTYQVANNEDGSKTLTPAFGAVTQEGTPVNATNMNHIEQGIADAHTAISTLETWKEGMDSDSVLAQAQQALAQAQQGVTAIQDAIATIPEDYTELAEYAAPLYKGKLGGSRSRSGLTIRYEDRKYLISGTGNAYTEDYTGQRTNAVDIAVLDGAEPWDERSATMHLYKGHTYRFSVQARYPYNGTEIAYEAYQLWVVDATSSSSYAYLCKTRAGLSALSNETNTDGTCVYYYATADVDVQLKLSILAGLKDSQKTGGEIVYFNYGTTSTARTVLVGAADVSNEEISSISNLSLHQPPIKKLNLGEDPIMFRYDGTDYQLTLLDMKKLADFAQSDTINREGGTITLGDTIINAAQLEGLVDFVRHCYLADSSSLQTGEDSQAQGQSSHAEGIGTTALNNGSHAEGKNTMASGLSSHAEGDGTTALGEAAHAEGMATLALADTAPHAEGRETRVTGRQGHAEGYKTHAAGVSAHAEGSESEALGDAAHAEGEKTAAIGAGAHAEGLQTEALGNYAHAEGTMSGAHALGAHAEGSETNAWGHYSHSEGLGTNAIHRAQHVAGEYNAPDPSVNPGGERGTYAEIVGNGLSTENRSNARTLDWQGNEALQGNLTLGMGTAQEATLTPADIQALHVMAGENSVSGRIHVLEDAKAQSVTVTVGANNYQNPVEQKLCAANGKNLWTGSATVNVPGHSGVPRMDVYAEFPAALPAGEYTLSYHYKGKRPSACSNRKTIWSAQGIRAFSGDTNMPAMSGAAGDDIDEDVTETITLTGATTGYLRTWTFVNGTDTGVMTNVMLRPASVTSAYYEAPDMAYTDFTSEGGTATVQLTGDRQIIYCGTGMVSFEYETEKYLTKAEFKDFVKALILESNDGLTIPT